MDESNHAAMHADQDNDVECRECKTYLDIDLQKGQHHYKTPDYRPTQRREHTKATSSIRDTDYTAPKQWQPKPANDANHTAAVCLWARPFYATQSRNDAWEMCGRVLLALCNCALLLHDIVACVGGAGVRACVAVCAATFYTLDV